MSRAVTAKVNSVQLETNLSNKKSKELFILESQIARIFALPVKQGRPVTAVRLETQCFLKANSLNLLRLRAAVKEWTHTFHLSAVFTEMVSLPNSTASG